MRLEESISDESALKELGRRLELARLDRNLSQAEVATRAGVGKSTVERLEAGGAAQLSNFLRVLRVLNLLDALDRVLPDQQISPIQKAELAGRTRRRASHGRLAAEAPSRSTPWQWGDKR